MGRGDRHDVTIATDELGTCRIAGHAYGQGPPLLLVHGLMNPAYSFRYLLDLLGDRYRRERGFPIPLLLVYAERDPIVPPAVVAHIDAAPRFIEAVAPFLR